MSLFKTKSFYGYCLFFLLLVACSNEQKSNSKTTIFKPNYKKTLDSIVPKLMAEYHAPAVGVGIIEDGKIEVVKVYGENQKGSKAPQNTIFNVASITKPVVTAAILKLVAHGDWDLDEPLYHYWTDPDVANDAYAKLITTRNCLSHTTGFKNWRWDEEDGKLKFNFKPGTEFQYSGEGMEYLRHAVESKFKIGLEKIVDSLVFKPLKMKDAKMGWLADKDTSRFAKWYDTRGNLHSINYKITKINAADDMLLTVNDLLLFGNAIMHKKVVDGVLYDEMIKPQSAINEKLNQGLGWVVYDKLSNGEYIINHDGGDPGVVTTLILFPKSQNGIVIFVNSDNGASITNTINKAILINGMEVIEGLHWETKIPRTIILKESILKKYVGTYKTNHNFPIRIYLENGSLFTDSPVFPKVKLLPMAQDQFYPLSFELYFKFIEINNKMKLQFLSSKKRIELEGEKQ
ncbi:serine hydrolase [Maribacter polysaccharolyticus]|uniref:serine hydrolase n=1 Tax=Maribacter polysaccharolyticus TaxID=3020831 RepID=UPI00237F73D2|nr:serine hydrolase [Maribacter polysaccharolyticus]MDE3741116.1 serine hydrolase [Maribacter polysaccharolyticus]